MSSFNKEEKKREERIQNIIHSYLNHSKGEGFIPYT